LEKDELKLALVYKEKKLKRPAALEKAEEKKKSKKQKSNGETSLEKDERKP